jgi:hypothetical protein
MTTAREQLANMLRQSRIDAGYGSHGALARTLNVSRPVVSKADLAGRPDVALHVIAEGVNVGLWGAFDIAARDSIVTVRLETIEDIPSTAPGLVGKVTVAFERILGAALPRADSLAIIRTAEERWKTQI